MIWYLIGFLCGLSAFAECYRHKQYFMAGVMLGAAIVCLWGALTDPAHPLSPYPCETDLECEVRHGS